MGAWASTGRRRGRGIDDTLRLRFGRVIAAAASTLEERTMKLRILLGAASVLVFASGLSGGYEKADQLGKLSFPTSCAPRVQALFDTGVAMLHSYWFGEAKKTFEDVLKDDPGCAMAHWGIALDYLGN